MSDETKQPEQTPDPNSIGDAPIQEQYVAQMQALAEVIDELFNGVNPMTGKVQKPRKTGFILMAFPFGDNPDNRCNYISNANRDDVIVMLREQIARFSGSPNQSGRA